VLCFIGWLYSSFAYCGESAMTVASTVCIVLKAMCLLALCGMD
jgi:hypothetical protein